MEIKDDGLFLKKMRLRQLEPELRYEVLELAASLGHETAIRADSNLHFLFRLYQAERAKEKKSRKALKKAEKLILTLVSLHHDAVMKRGGGRPPGRERRKPRLALLGERIPISKKTRDLLAAIGITKGEDVEMVVGLLGEKKTQERAEYALASKLEDKVLKGIYGTHTELFIMAGDDDFLSRLENMENKKDFLDSWAIKTGKPLPEKVDYRVGPSALLEDYKTFMEEFKVEVAAMLEREIATLDKEKRKAPGYRGKPMHPRDFIKVIKALGFTKKRDANHGDLFENKEGTMMCVQNAHRSQMQLNRSVVKKKLAEAGIDLDLFHKIRKGLGL